MSADTAPTDSPTARQVWRAARGPVMVGLILVLIAAVPELLSRGERAGYLDPEAPSPNGGRALAQILGDRGVTVRVARSVDAARAAAGPDSLLLVTRSWVFTRPAVDEVASIPGDRVLVTPTEAMLDRLAGGVQQVRTVGVAPREPACGLRAARLAGTADMGGAVYSPPAADGRPAAAMCYASGGRPSLLRITTGDRTVTVLGTGDPLTNERLDERGNAALALNLLGSARTLVWLWPAAPQLPGEQQQSPWELVPNEVKLAVFQLALAVVLVALWRARRLGPVVTEQLPVIVRSAETAEGRGRLYRARRARDSAADALRRACRDRTARRLGLPRGSGPDEVVAAVSARTGWPATAVHELLYGATPGDDAALVRLAGDLDELERRLKER